MMSRYVLWWGLRAAIALGAVVLAITWQAYGQAGPGVVHAGAWEGDWNASTGHWVGTVTWQFDDSGDEKWTDAEKKVVREAAAEWEKLGDSSVDFEEVKEGADLKLKWKDHGLGGHVGGVFTPLPIGMNQAPDGISFNPNATAGWYVDPDPTTDEAIPGGKWDLLSVAKHELGHTLGLKHSNPPPPEAMDTAGGLGNRQHPTESDHKAIAKLYPVSQPNNCGSCQDMTFPVAGLGAAPITVVFDIDMTPVDWNRVDCSLSGVKGVNHGQPTLDSNGDTTVDIEIVNMSLTGTCELDGPVQVNVTLNPAFRSLGEITGNPDPNSDFPADSFFDVFFDIEMRAFGQTFPHRTQDPLTFGGTIDGIPPFGTEFAPWNDSEFPISAMGSGAPRSAVQALDSTCDPGDPIAIPIFSTVVPTLVAGFICDATLMMPPANSISALKQDDGGQPLSGWKISLFAGANCPGNPIVSDTTDTSGTVEFNNLGPLVYSLRETLKPGSEAVSPICQDVNLSRSPGQVPVIFTNALALIQGNVDCDPDVDSVDALKEQRHIAGLSVSQTAPCPEIGSEVASLFGDVDCDNDIDAVDALKIQRFVVGLPVSQTEPCPDIGDALVITAVTANSDSPVTAAMPFAAAFGIALLGLGGLRGGNRWLRRG